MKKSEAEQCVYLAEQIVLRRRIKHLKNKGRKFTSRSRKQFFNGPYKKQVKCVLLVAAKRTKEKGKIKESIIGVSQDKHESVSRLIAQLQTDLRRARRRRGKPPIRKGLIESVICKPIKRRGRPRTAEPDEVNRWIQQLWGTSTALWAEREHFPPNASLDDVLGVLLQQPDWQSELEALFPEAIRSQMMQPCNISAKNTRSLIQRARVARKTYSLPGQLKSGG